MTNIVLDKQLKAEIDQPLGQVGIRVVVFKKKAPGEAPASDNSPLDQDTDEDFSLSDSEVNSFLELPKRGKLCCVFLLNGQRHHGLDNSFIVHNLGMKYLRKRMVIVVDLDGLTDEARAEIIQGSRSGFYEGRVYQKIHDRIVSTLKKDPELLELEDEAEDELAQLQVGSAAVQDALDQLISNHFDFGDHAAEGVGDTAGKQGFSVSDEGKKVQLDVVKSGLDGVSASTPVLLCSYERPTLRMYPDEKAKLHIAVDPKADWKHLIDMVVVIDPVTPGLTHSLIRKNDYAVLELEFKPPPDFDLEEYPLESTLSVLATFKNQNDLRLLDKLVVIKPKGTKPPVPPTQLRDDPTFLKINSRQPIRLFLGEDAVHVKIRWDGKDELTYEPAPKWRFEGICLGQPAFPAITFTLPSNGRFEALMHVPAEMSVGTRLKFEVRAIGPGGKTLLVQFNSEIVELATPRKMTADLPQYGQRRPPYKLVIVREENFKDDTRWGDNTWDDTHSGAFIEPKPDKPLRLCINEDFGLLRAYLDKLVAKKADEQRTEEKKTKYIAHIAYHLYQMYLDKEEILKMKAKGSEVQEPGSEVREPQDEEMQHEINRVAATLVRLMEVSR